MSLRTFILTALKIQYLNIDANNFCIFIFQFFLLIVKLFITNYLIKYYVQ